MTSNAVEILAQLGLDEGQVKVYRALLSLGPASIRDVVAEAGINRGSTYKTLKQLTSVLNGVFGFGYWR